MKKEREKLFLWNRKLKCITVFFMFAVVFTIAGCSNKADKQTSIDDTLITPEANNNLTATPLPTPVVMTPAPGITLSPTPEVTVTPTPTTIPIGDLSEEEAQKLVLSKLDTKNYSAGLSDDHLNIDGETYYVYVISDSGGTLEPAIIVNKKNGALYTYDIDGNVTAFVKFPLDNVEIVDQNEDMITETEALELLKKMKKEKLGLVNNLSHYNVVADSWTTVVAGEECYCFNVFEGRAENQLVGMYYVSVSGDNIYRFEEENSDFIKIN